MSAFEPAPPEPGEPTRYRFPEIACPSCGVIVNAASDPRFTTRAPRLGDGTICTTCVQPSMIVINLDGAVRLRKLTDEEMEDFIRRNGPLVEAIFDFKLREREDKYKD